MSKTRIYIVRHGQSIGNQKQLMLGHTDLDLTELGLKQACATADFLKDTKIDKIYSSDLKRAYNTALPHANIRNTVVNALEGVREFYLGDWEGKSVESIINDYGDMFAESWHGGFGTFTFPSGEAVMDGGRRFYRQVLSICEECPDMTILIAAHAGVIRSFWSIISGIAPENIVRDLPFPTNASYSICDFIDGVIVPIEYSSDSHLTEVGITSVISYKK